MKIAQGHFYDGASSRRTEVALYKVGSAVSVRTAQRELLMPTPLASIEVSSRIGNTPRYLRFADGAVFETNDNDAIDGLISEIGAAPGQGLLHRLESRLRFIVPALVLVIAFVWGGIAWGIPALARTAAFSLPASTSELIGEGALEILDSHFFGPSQLSEETQQRIQAGFAPLIKAHRGQFDIDVAFRHGDGLGANAMALPSGTIIFTDELVALATTDQELQAILLHEIGHITGRHSLRQGIQGSVLGALVVLVMGDVSSLSSMVTGIPVILTELGYSRAFEQEADRFAFKAMRDSDIGPEHFVTILRRIEQSHVCPENNGPEKSKGTNCGPSREKTGGVSDYFSTHPPTEERLREFMRSTPSS